MAPLREHPDQFVRRHIGPAEADLPQMLMAVAAESVDELVDRTIPAAIRLTRPLQICHAVGEYDMLSELQAIAEKNRDFRSYIGMGYYDCITPPVIQRNILENPGWYTAYTPYQAEISQGRLEALLNYQTMLVELTGLEIANASLLDEATAAAEAMAMLFSIAEHDPSRAFLVSTSCHPQTIGVIQTRAEPIGIKVIVCDERDWNWSQKLFGAIVQYPATDGEIREYRSFCDRAHAEGAHVVAATDLLSLALLVPPGEWGADVAVGSSQRFGVPLGYGGPHAGFFATRSEFVRKIPGRLIGVSRDSRGQPALRMTLQTREQHIRRDKATSNICTAQVLLAVVAGMYATYHGPQGLRAIAKYVHDLAVELARRLRIGSVKVRHQAFFDTLCLEATPRQVKTWIANAQARNMNFRVIDDQTLGISLDETTRPRDIEEICEVLGSDRHVHFPRPESEDDDPAIPASLRRTGPILRHPVFDRYRSETEMLRYIKSLENRDFSLTHGMIPLGSCTMKLNAAAEMIPITWPRFNRLHPYVPREQAAGYATIVRDLENWLGEITGLPAVSLQPNAGSQGEYAGLLVIRKYHRSRGQGHRDICLIPTSAHGTNPASAVMAGYKVVAVNCDPQGNIDLDDLATKAGQHEQKLAALMVTYPSTYGVFEEGITRSSQVVHEFGGQVYLDGANLNAQVGLCRPGDYGADVCHLNLHKTFCIPHGGGGPGMGPIAVAAHLSDFLPGHPVVNMGGQQGIGPVSAAPWGSPSILLISWAYIRLMGGAGLTEASKFAILNANYLAQRLEPYYPVLYRGTHNTVAHECILDTRPLKKSAGVEVEDIAKRLMDYGFHAPTISFPVPGTLMIEPTESESLEELDRFCEAMIAIRGEIQKIERGEWPRDDNPLKHAPHTADVVAGSQWSRPYSREEAAFPTVATRATKFWPSVGRIDNAYGDRHLFCSCPPMESSHCGMGPK